MIKSQVYCFLDTVYIYRDSPGDSMRRGQRTLRPNNKENRHTCFKGNYTHLYRL